MELAREARGRARGRRFRMEEMGASGGWSGRGGCGAKKKRIGNHGHGGEVSYALEVRSGEDDVGLWSCIWHG